MSGTQAPILPPVFDPPVMPDGQHSQAWTAFHQDVSDRLAALGKGVVDGSEAKAGTVGEVLTASGGPIGISNNAATTVATLPLTAGDWDVSGQVTYTEAAGTHASQIAASVSTVTNTLQQATSLIAATFGTGSTLQLGTAGSARVNGAAASSVFLVAFTTFTGGTMQAGGIIRARRMR